MSQVSDFIASEAPKYHVDPLIALRVAGHEGLNAFNPNLPDRGGDGGSSFGPFQLHYGGINPAMPRPGLGDDFTRATGLDAQNPATWRQQVDFALRKASQGGWSPWMGAKAAGVAPYQGIGSILNLAPTRENAALAAAGVGPPTRENAAGLPPSLAGVAPPANAAASPPPAGGASPSPQAPAGPDWGAIFSQVAQAAQPRPPAMGIPTSQAPLARSSQYQTPLDLAAGTAPNLVLTS